MSDDDSQPMMSVQMGAVAVTVKGNTGDDLDDVQEKFDHALEQSLDGADQLDDVGPI